MKTLMLSILIAIPACAVGLASQDESAARPASTGADEMDAMMARYMELAQPGEPHKKLDPFAGEFTFEARMRMEPDGPWMGSKGTMKTRWVLGGRYQLSEYQSESHDMGAFQGLGLLGYDNAKQRYVSTWLDTWGTMIPPVGEGSMEQGVLTMHHTLVNPVTQKTESYRDVTTLVDRDHYTFEMYTPSPNGELYRNLEIRYTRK